MQSMYEKSICERTGRGQRWEREKEIERETPPQATNHARGERGTTKETTNRRARGQRSNPLTNGVPETLTVSLLHGSAKSLPRQRNASPTINTPQRGGNNPRTTEDEHAHTDGQKRKGKEEKKKGVQDNPRHRPNLRRPTRPIHDSTPRDGN